MLAKRTMFLKSSATATWTAAEAIAACSDHIIDLSIEEICSELAPSIREGAIAAINRNLSRHTDAVDLPELRNALARKISDETAQPWSADEIAVTSGAKQSLFNAVMVLLNPGDEVLIPAPYWTPLPAQIGIAGGTPVFIETRHNNYLPKLSDLTAAITEKTKAIVVNTPSNPTGAIYNRTTLGDIAQLAIDRNLWIIFDECCGNFIHAPHTHHQIVSVTPRVRARTLLVNSLSTSLAPTGWRIGYLAGPKAIISAVRALQADTSSPNLTGQHALLHHLESADSAFELRLQRHVSNARSLGLSILSTLTSVPQPAAQGGFYFYLDLTRWLRRVNAHGRDINADDVVNVLLMDAGVVAISGTAYGDPVGVRLSYGIDLGLLDKALRRLAVTLNTWN
ncbi:aspartate aminotransferase [Bradyrhizobium sacchari]|uniref:aspartate transaminase n=2 Tax=Bradyrhizobium sacchari TaxID=1399419 RepID=A0A560JCK5_9BRAD|nr:aspartate aminotransferase [Bradyrhizobium sacchari]TWB47619.1 aspartate aminotransferase [Bradyrhizobium sacchari]TWB66150.1 aspartate aminotransferase [Bradyrhizobium sacchari]